ncbi:hypothetical protein JCM16303_001775 [Sporobolomyces ruberrimus]
MNSLPPELVSRIVEYAATCDSTYSSYRQRQKTLASLTLVSCTFHEIVQPILPRDLWFRREGSFSAFCDNTALSEQVESFIWEHASSPAVAYGPLPFRRLRQMYLTQIIGGPPEYLSDNQHLTRLAFSNCGFTLRSSNSSFVLPHLEELSLDNVRISVRFAIGANEREFLTHSHFPSVRALGIQEAEVMDRESIGPLEIPSDFLAQLECVSIDKIKNLPPSQPSFPLPVLFDIDPRYAMHSWGRSSLSPTSALSQAYVRIRITSSTESIPHRREIEAALFLAESIIRDTPDLKQLYLDLYPRDRRRGYVLDNELEERIKVLEDPRRKKKVEIIWENHGDDMLKSLVSREFWKVCRREKEKRESEM